MQGHNALVCRDIRDIGMGWPAAGKLQVGDRMRTAYGADIAVVGLRDHVSEEVVYTLTVAKDHTFFVGGARVLAHNAICPSSIAPRVVGQLKDPRLGPLAGTLTPDDLQRLVNNPAANRFYDAATGNINVIQDVGGRLIRITVARDALPIISVGPIQLRNVVTSVASGRFVRLP